MNNQEKTPKSLTVYVGVKSDPIQYRYSFEWLFDLMAEENVFHLQLGSFTELFFLSDSYFEKLRATAESRRITISSVFTSHRELGGFLVEDPEFARITMRNSRRLIEIAEIVGSPVAGSSMGGVYRDRLWYRQEGVRRYIEGMKELMHDAKEHGLSWLTVEPMSCYAEPPCHSQEMISLMEEFRSYHAQNEDDTVQFGLCSDVSHGWANTLTEVIETNENHFLASLPYMYEFHFKNTDSIYNETFGFEPDNLSRGVVDISRIHFILSTNQDLLPTSPIIGYLELPGPKLGRDYTDNLLEGRLRSSLRHLNKEFLSVTGEGR